MSIDTVADVARLDSADGRRQLRWRRVAYGSATVLLAMFAGAALIDARHPVFGVDSATTSATSGDGTEIVVTHPRVIRPGLAAPFAVEVTRASGFDGPVELAVSRTWLEAWDTNAWSPSPASEIGERDWVVLEFDPPAGDTLRVFLDARLEPGRQASLEGGVQLRGTDPVTEVAFTTRVLP